MQNVKKIVITLLVSICLIICILYYVLKIKTNIQIGEEIKGELKREDYFDENGEYHHYYEVSSYTEDYGYGDNREIVCMLLNDERDKWKFLPLSDNFIKKYSNRKILDDNSIIEFSSSDGYNKYMYSLELEKDDEFYTRRVLCKKTDGIYVYVFNLDLDKKQKNIEDIHILDIIKMYDNDTGYTEDYYIKFNAENFILLFTSIMFPNIKSEGNYNIDRHNVALTKKFLDKYGYDKDIIENTTGVPLTRFTISDEDFENRKFMCSCLYNAQNLWIKYEVKFSLTDDGQLENIENYVQ